MYLSRLLKIVCSCVCVLWNISLIFFFKKPPHREKNVCLLGSSDRVIIFGECLQWLRWMTFGRKYGDCLFAIARNNLRRDGCDRVIPWRNFVLFFIFWKLILALLRRQNDGLESYWRNDRRWAWTTLNELRPRGFFRSFSTWCWRKSIGCLIIGKEVEQLCFPEMV